jgi:hypothetical protein
VDAEGVDPELLALPEPPKRGRTLTVLVLAVTALASVAMMFALRRDVAYAFAPGTPTDVGDFRTAPPATLASLENAYVTAHGMLGVAGGIRYERPFHDETFRALPVAGRPDVWVEVKVPPGKENPRWGPPRSVTGRLVRFDATGPRHRGISEAVAVANGHPVPHGAWLLVDGEQPAHARVSVALCALFLAFALWNAWTIGMLVRRVRG